MWSSQKSEEPQTTGNTIQCRAYYAQRGQRYGNISDCLAAQHASTIGHCVPSTTIEGNDPVVDTYCSNHIHACGLKTWDNPNGEYESLTQCREQAATLSRSPYRNAFIGNNLQCRLNFAFQAVEPLWQNTTCRDTGMASTSYCNDESCPTYCAIASYACGNRSQDDFKPSYACAVDWCPSIPYHPYRVNVTRGDSREWYHLATRLVDCVVSD
jgi:hypothetical protein